MNLRDRKKARTRQALVDAAVLLFLERGHAGTTVEDIAAASGVSRRTFFRYFPSKEAAFFAVEHDRFEAFGRTLDAGRATLGAWGAARAAFAGFAADHLHDRRASLAWHAAVEASTELRAQEVSLARRWETRLREALTAEVESGVVVAVRAGATLGAVRAAIADWHAGEGRGDLSAAVALALDWLEASELAYENSERTLSQRPCFAGISDVASSSSSRPNR